MAAMMGRNCPVMRKIIVAALGAFGGTLGYGYILNAPKKHDSARILYRSGRLHCLYSAGHGGIWHHVRVFLFPRCSFRWSASCWRAKCARRPRSFCSARWCRSCRDTISIWRCWRWWKNRGAAAAQEEHGRGADRCGDRRRRGGDTSGVVSGTGGKKIKNCFKNLNKSARKD